MTDLSILDGPVAYANPTPLPGGAEGERFWSKVDKTGSCWLWTASCSLNGYGQFSVRSDTGNRWTKVRAHRWAYTACVGPIPDGMQIDHLCRVRRCVNPDHMEPVTGQVNTLRGESVSSANAQKTHCPAGHEYTPENTRVSKRNQRACRECNRANNRRRHDAAYWREWRRKRREERAQTIDGYCERCGDAILLGEPVRPFEGDLIHRFCREVG